MVFAHHFYIGELILKCRVKDRDIKWRSNATIRVTCFSTINIAPNPEFGKRV